MNENERDFSIVQKEHQENIRAKLIKFTSNEISFFNSPFPAFYDFNDKINQIKSEFTDQFLNHTSSFTPKFFSDKIKEKFSKKYEIQNKSSLIEFLQFEIDHIKWRSDIVYNRINKSETYRLFANYYPLYIDSISKFSEKCNLAIQSLESEKPDYHYIESIIKYDFYHNFCHFQIDNLLYTFKKFPLIRRKEIFSIVKETLIKDLIFDLNQESIPTIITQSEDLIEELKRLSSFLNIEFDIDIQDGQHFSYSCEKLFFKILNQNVSFDCIDKPVPMIEYPSFLDLLNDKFIKQTQIDENINFAFDNLINPSEEGVEQILKKFNIALIRELTKDKVTAFVRLQFCKNKTILNSIINSIKNIEKIAKKILKKDLENFFNDQLTIFRKITLVVASSVKLKSSKPFLIDNESLLEMILDLYDQFYKYKVEILNSLFEIDVNSQNIDISSITKKFIEFRPDLVGGDHKLCIQPFRLSVNTLKQISLTLRSLINLQIYTQKEFGFLYGHHFLLFEFPSVDTKYQRTNDSFPYSPFEVFPFLKKISKFMHVSREIVLEITESFSVRSTRYKPYFEYAIWTQLLNEMENFITNLTPESYAFNTKISEKVSHTMTSLHLNDLNFILKTINEYKGKNKLGFVTNFRNMIRLGWKLQSFLVKTDICMKIYKEQLSKLDGNNSEQLIIDFAYGDYEFGAISNDWTSNELEKITNAQHCYKEALEIAVRFNNYHYDVDTIQQVLEMNQYEIQLQPKAKQGQINRQKAVKRLPSLLFFEPNLIDDKLYSNINLCYITAAKDFTNTNYLINFYIPYSIRSEIAFICILERCLLHSYSDYGIFYTSTNLKHTFINGDNKFNHFFLPITPQALFFDTNYEILYNVLRFISTRYQLLKYMQHDGYISRIKNNDLEEIYREKLLWSSNLFSRIRFELGRCIQCDDAEFSANYLNKEKEIFCSKQFMIVISVLNFCALPKVEDKKKKNNNAEIEEYTFESVHSFLIDMNRPILGSSSFMDSSLYAQTYLDQFWYQCNDALRLEFAHYQSQIEKKVSDSIVGATEDKYMDAIYDFSTDSVRFDLMRLAKFYLDYVKDPKKVTIDSIINNLTKEMIIDGSEKFDSENNILATYKTDVDSKSGSLEANFLKAKINAITEEIGNMIEKYQIKIFNDQIKKEADLVESVFHKPTSVLKPECYKERIPMKSSQQIFIPPIPSLENQFAEEVNYTKLLFCRDLCNCISKNKKFEEDSFSINVDEFKISLKDLSNLLSIFFNESRFKLIKTWKGYIQNMLYILKNSSDMHESMNAFVIYFINRFNSSVYSDLSVKLKEDYIKVAHLRDKEKVINQEQEHFEKKEAKKIRKEFELLVHDLHEEISKAKNRFIVAKNKFYDSSFIAINKIKNDPDYINKCVRPPLTNEPPKKIEQSQKSIENEKSEIVNTNEQEMSSSSSEKEMNLTEIEIDSSASEIKEIEELKQSNVSFDQETKEIEELKQSNVSFDQEKKEIEELKSSNVSFNQETKEIEELKPSNVSFDQEKKEIEESKAKNVSFQHETFEQINENELSKTEAFPSFSTKSIIINSPKQVDTIMLTTTEKIAVISQLSDEDELDQQIQKPPEKTEQQQEKVELNEPLEHPKLLVIQENRNEKKPISAPPQNENKSRRVNLRKSSSNKPKVTNDLLNTIGNIELSGRRSINLKKYQNRKMKTKQQRINTTSTDELNAVPEISELSSLSSFILPLDSHQFQPKKQKQKEKPREMIQDVTERIEVTKKSIEELQNLRKKLRISTTISAIAVKRIYTRMIAKVAEERKNHSADLWRGRRLLEEDLKEKNDELKEAYKQLSKADSEIEFLQEEIAKTKEANIKLLHAKELNIRQADLIHKELRKVSVNADINVVKLLKQINQKQEELDFLIVQQQNFEEELYYQVTEPMIQTDSLRRQLTIRKGKKAEEKYFKQLEKQQQIIEQEEQNESKKEEEEKSISNEEDKNESKSFENSGNLGSNNTSFILNRSNLSLSEQINLKISNYKEQNEDLKIENDELRNKIIELEKQISEVPNSRKQLLNDLFQPDSKSAKPKSYKSIFKPSRKHKLSKSAKNKLRPGSSRNYL